MIKAVRGKKSLIPVVLALLCCIFIALPVVAGEGDGSGGGQGVPLGLASSNPVNGQKNVPVTTDINLTFNKNVVNLAVKDNNIKCFSLLANGSNVPIQVNMPDDQVDFEHRRNIDLNPVQNLQPGTLYKVVISGQLQAKNGTSLGSPVTISFTTAGVPADQQANQNNNTPQDTQKLKTDNSTKPASNASEQQTTEQITGKAQEDQKVTSPDIKEKEKGESPVRTESQDKKEAKNNNREIAVAAGLVLVAAGGYGYYRYSHKQ